MQSAICYSALRSTKKDNGNQDGSMRSEAAGSSDDPAIGFKKGSMESQSLHLFSGGKRGEGAARQTRVDKLFRRKEGKVSDLNAP